MEILYIFFIFIALVVIYYYSKVPYSTFSNGKHHFKQTIPDSTINFLQDCFDISKADCYAFRFNGDRFFLRKKIHYKFIESITCESNINVTTHNSSLPIQQQWAYQNVDGGPDLRYKQNPMTMTTRRYKIRFKGAKRGIMYLYDFPYGFNPDIQDAINRFNNMLNLKNTIDIKEYRLRYKAIFLQLKTLQELRFKHTQRQNTAKEVEKAFLSLPSHLKSKQIDLVNKFTKAKEEINETRNSLTQIDCQIRELSNDMKDLTNQVKQEHMKNASIEIIRAYNSSIR